MADDLKLKITADSKQAEQDYKNFTKQIDQSSKTAFKQAAKSAKDYVNENKKGLKDLSSYLDKILKEETANTSKAEKEKIKIVNASLKEQEKLARIHARAMAENINFDKKQTAKQNRKPQGIFGGNLEFAENLTVVTAGLVAMTSALSTFTVSAVNSGAELLVLRGAFTGTKQDLELLRKATAGTVSDANLIKLSNQASDLGVSLKDQSLLFSLAEDAADKYGGSVEENFQKVIFASDGTAKGLRAVGISVNAFKQEVEKLTKAQNVNLDTLDAEAQQNIRLQAIYNLTGTNIESVKNKTKDYKDVLDSVKVAGENFIATFGGQFIKGLADTADGFVKIADKTGLVKKDFNVLEAAAISLGIVLSKFNTVGFFTFLINQLGEVKQLIGDIGGFGFLREGAKLSSQIAESGRGDALGLVGSLTPSTDTDASKRIKQTSRGGNDRANKEKIDKAIIDGLEQQIKNLFETTLTPMESADRIKFLMGTKIAEFSAATITGSENVRNPFAISPIEEDMAAQRELLLSTLSEAGNNLASIVGTFGFKTDSVLSQAVDKFQMILNLIEGTLSLISNIGTAVSIFKTLFGIATGGGAIQAGTGGMPYINPPGTSGGGSNYFKIDLNTMAIVKDGLPKYNEYKGAIAVN